MVLLIKGGHLIDPANNIDGIYDILIEKGKISEVANDIRREGVKTIDVRDRFVFPGLIDIHCHLRQPGRDDEETLLSAGRAAAKGGFTSLLCMPNTNPVIDNAEVVSWIKEESERIGLVNIFPAGAITKGEKGEELAELGELKEAGCLAVSDDGKPVENSLLMRRALEYAKMLNLLIISHCEDLALSFSGLINEGKTSTLLGLGGIPEIAESIMVAREIELAYFLKTPIHLAHISSSRSLELIRRAKKNGIRVSCDTCPHYFTLSEEATRGFDTNTKVNPPLKTGQDMEAIKGALKDGTIEAISTDHAPHTEAEKELEYKLAPFGIIGLETTLSLGIAELVDKGILSWKELVEKMSLNPAKLLGLKNKGRLSKGADADIIIVNPHKKWKFSKENIISKSKNSPFIDCELKGALEYTICGGKIVYKEK